MTDYQSRSRHGHELLENISHGHGRDRDRDRDHRDSRRSRRALVKRHGSLNCLEKLNRIRRESEWDPEKRD